MDISVLLPTRGRTKLLQKSIVTLIETAENPQAVEIILGVDDDDKKTKAAYKSLKQIPESNIRIVYSGKIRTLSRGQESGYHLVYLITNNLAQHAKGKWLLLWNDDAYMKTEGWDKMITDIEDPLSIVNFCYSPVPGQAVSNPFPIINKKIVDITGVFSACWACDDWAVRVGEKADLIKYAGPVQIKHTPGGSPSGHKRAKKIARKYRAQNEKIEAKIVRKLIKYKKENCR